MLQILVLQRNLCFFKFQEKSLKRCKKGGQTSLQTRSVTAAPFEKLANQLPWFEGGASSTPKWVPKLIKTERKSMKNQVCVLGAFWVDPWRPNAPNTFKYGSQFWDQFLKKIEKNTTPKGIQNQCKKITKFEAKLGPQMRSKSARKSKIFLSGPRWVFLCRSSFY